MPDNTTVLPNKGTPQGGIISPLLANIVLNELDWWIASQWEENPIAILGKLGTSSRFLSAFTIFAEDRRRFGNFREQVLTIALTFHYL